MKPPTWVLAFCCISPFVALVLIAIGQLFGSSIASMPTFGVTCLCAQTTRHMMGPKPKP